MLLKLTSNLINNNIKQNKVNNINLIGSRLYSKTNGDSENYDIMKDKVISKSVHNLGFVRLVDVMPRLISDGETGDNSIVNAARVSYGKGTSKVSNNEDLIRYLYRNYHTTPFEMAEVKFHVKCSIMDARQWFRHRTGSFNEISGRYSVMKDEFYEVEPSMVKLQSKNNKQGRNTDNIDMDTLIEFVNTMNKSRKIYSDYKSIIDKGIARELCRLSLPLSLYTEFYWKTNLWNLLRFLRLRNDDHAQYEIRSYAKAIEEIVEPFFPFTFRAFNDYERNSIKLSRVDLDEMRFGDCIKNKREKAEFDEKMKKLNEYVDNVDDYERYGY